MGCGGQRKEKNMDSAGPSAGLKLCLIGTVLRDHRQNLRTMEPDYLTCLPFFSKTTRDKQRD